MLFLCLARNPASPSTVYAGIRYHGVGKSTDGGMTWNPANNGIPGNESVVALAVDPSSPQTVYAGTYDGLFKSINGGASWTPVAGGLPPASIPAWRSTRPARLRCRPEQRSGLYKSIDGGATWSASRKRAAGRRQAPGASRSTPPTSTLYHHRERGMQPVPDHQRRREVERGEGRHPEHHRQQRRDRGVDSSLALRRNLRSGRVPEHRRGRLVERGQRRARSRPTSTASGGSRRRWSTLGRDPRRSVADGQRRRGWSSLVPGMPYVEVDSLARDPGTRTPSTSGPGVASTSRATAA